MEKISWSEVGALQGITSLRMMIILETLNFDNLVKVIREMSPAELHVIRGRCQYKTVRESRIRFAMQFTQGKSYLEIGSSIGVMHHGSFMIRREVLYYNRKTQSHYLRNWNRYKNIVWRNYVREEIHHA